MPLHPAACAPEASRGRRIAEPPAPTRNAFQRDRDRVVHCTAFRRLVYKTQVFLNHEGDLFRTRLTHSLEVAQIARSIARSLGLHEDLVEAVALAHDLGHTPFGHAGQDALNACMRRVDPEGGGFEHNFQSLRVVDVLEQRYPAFDGLNLSFETREGILKHCSRRNAQWLQAHDPTGLGSRFLQGTQPSLEAQLCDLADRIAYNAHDIDDGIRSGLLTIEQLDDLPPVRRYRLAVLSDHPAAAGRRLLFEMLRRMLSDQVYDVITETRRMLADAAPADVDAVRRGAERLVRFSPPVSAEVEQTQQFLRVNLYRHPQVQATTGQAREVLHELFDLYLGDPAQMSSSPAPEASLARAVADYISGMTDRFALQEHRRLTGREHTWPAVTR